MLQALHEEREQYGELGPSQDQAALSQATAVVAYPPDANILGEALVAEVDYPVSLDCKHLVANPRASELPLPIGTPGEFRAWFRQHLQEGA